MTLEQLKKDLKNKNPIIGLERTLKEIRNGSVVTVYMAANCGGAENVRRCCKIYNTKLIELDEKNNQIGVTCKKPFSISVLCFKK